MFTAPQVVPGAVHNMPTVISKPRILMTQPAVINTTTANGPLLANGTHIELKKEGKYFKLTCGVLMPWLYVCRGSCAVK